MELTILVVRTGGVAGLRRRWELQLDCEREAETWQPLLDACPWDSLATGDGSGSAPAAGARDRFSYRITAGDRTATVPERELRGPWRELTDRVREAAEHGSETPVDSSPEG